MDSRPCSVRANLIGQGAALSGYSSNSARLPLSAARSGSKVVARCIHGSNGWIGRAGGVRSTRPLMRMQRWLAGCWLAAGWRVGQGPPPANCGRLIPRPFPRCSLAIVRPQGISKIPRPRTRTTPDVIGRDRWCTLFLRPCAAGSTLGRSSVWLFPTPALAPAAQLVCERLAVPRCWRHCSSFSPSPPPTRRPLSSCHPKLVVAVHCQARLMAAQ